MDDKKAVHHTSPNIEVVKHHKDSLPSWDELKYFIRKYYLFLLIIALIPVVLYSLGQQLANRGSAAPRLQLNTGGKVGVQTGGGDLPVCADSADVCKADKNYNKCWMDQYGNNRGGFLCKCVAVITEGTTCDQYQLNCSEQDLQKCPFNPSPTGGSTTCSPGDQIVGDCGSAVDGSNAMCRVCQSNGEWDTSKYYNCPNDSIAAAYCNKPTLTPNPQGAPAREEPQATTEPPVGRGQEPTLIPAEQGGGNCTIPPGNNGAWRNCEGDLGSGQKGNNAYNCVNGTWFKYPFQSGC